MSEIVTRTEWQLQATVFRGADLAGLLQEAAAKVSEIGWDMRVWDVVASHEDDEWQVTVYWVDSPLGKRQP